jgi:16S rRNA (adenine1518-N6/adenine1519-N6)-dimethyltransferase
MSDLPPLHVPDLLRRYGLHPRKGLGQNFLLDETALRRVVEAAEITADAEVLEIGPGLGSLTRWLASAARRVVAVELDASLLPPLREALCPCPNVEVIQGDILEVNPADLFQHTGYWVVANIPYYITSAVIRHLLESPARKDSLAPAPRPHRIVLTVQREVAERILAKPGDLSLLALSVQVYGQARLAGHIPAGAFYPPPNVDSAIIRIDLHPEPRLPAAQLPAFFRLIKAGFSQKRKTLRNALSAGLGAPPVQIADLLQRAGIEPQRRAETLSIEEWERLVLCFLSEVPSHA